MVEIGFYHLTRTELLAALPPLLARTLQAGQNALVRCATTQQVEQLDAALWTTTAAEWLPHGTAQTPHPAWQPIFLTTELENPADAKFLFVIDGKPADLTSFARCFDLFDGRDDAAVAAARTRWTQYRGQGHSLAYWRQGDAGWERGA